MKIVNLCRECSIWMKSLFVILFRLELRSTFTVIMQLQNVNLIFPNLARRITFASLAKRSVYQKDGGSMNNLAVCYAKGVGVFKDSKRAFLWYKAASRAGCAYAMHSLGGCYYNGWGVAVNEKLAFRAFLQAAQHGHFAAACYLGLMYSYGEYVEKSQEKAFLWYRIGALHGDANSQYDLSKCLRYGEGCQVDRNFADLWLMIAAKNGSIEAREYLKGIVNKTIS